LKIITKILVIAFIILILLFLVLKLEDIILRKVYPLKYSEYVEKYASEEELDPLLIYAIIKAESNFETNITSSSGAMGLMQLMDSTAREVTQKIGIAYPTKEILYDPETNILIGIKYYSMLIEKYDGNMLLALTSYNAGIGNVDKWIQAGTIKKDGSDIENIPFKETNNYVRKILRDYKIYQELYK
jgi:soluble lytic murein transglycosylase